MKILDRYIVRSFLLNYVLLFVILVSLIMLLNLIINFDEFLQACPEGALIERLQCLAWAIYDYHWPTVFLYFVYLAGMLPIAAAGFTLVNLMRKNELTAMLASGRSMQRIGLPILIVGCASNVLLFADQEWVIPRLADQLARTHTDVKVGYVRDFPLELTPDSRGALFYAGRYAHRDGRMNDVTIIVRDDQGRTERKILADSAVWNDQRNGWELTQGRAIERGMMNADSATQTPTAPAIAQQPVKIGFFPSDLDPTTIMLKRRDRYRALLSQAQLSELIQKSRIVDADELKFIKHNRFAQVVINILIVPIGLSFYLLRTPANMLLQTMKMAGQCGGAWGGAFVLQQVGIGTVPAMVAAWLPVIFLLPMAAYRLSVVET